MTTTNTPESATEADEAEWRTTFKAAGITSLSCVLALAAAFASSKPATQEEIDAVAKSGRIVHNCDEDTYSCREDGVPSRLNGNFKTLEFTHTFDHN